MAAILEIKTGGEANWHGLQTAGYQILVSQGWVTTNKSRPGECWYDLLTHSYEIDGCPIISVTQALTRAGRIDATWFTENSRHRGTLIHDATRIFDSILNPPAIDETIGGFFEAYLAFRVDLRPRFRYIEEPFWYARERFAGRPDRVLISFNAIAQHGRFLLYLHANGNYRLKRCRQAKDYSDFREVLASTRDAITIGTAV